MTAPRRVEPLASASTRPCGVPGSKSITNRALVCAALADGTSVIEGALCADDTEAMVDCLRSLGVGIGVDVSSGQMTVSGCGGRATRGERSRSTSACPGRRRASLLPVAGAGHGRYELDGGEPMRRRPMGPLIDALRALGVDVDEAGRARSSAAVAARRWRRRRTGRRCRVTCRASSCRACCWRRLVREGHRSRTDHRTRLGVPTSDSLDRSCGRSVRTPTDLAVAPGRYRAARSPSSPTRRRRRTSSRLRRSAAVGSRVDGLGTQIAARRPRVRRRPRARWARPSDADATSTTVTGTARSHGIDVDLRDLLRHGPDARAVVACSPTSPTTITGVGFIRGKETDRIDAVVTELRRCGIDADRRRRRVHGRSPGRPHAARDRDLRRPPDGDGVRAARPRASPASRSPIPGCVAKTFPGVLRRRSTQLR